MHLSVFLIGPWMIQMVFHPNNKPDLVSQPKHGILLSFIWSWKLADLTSSSKTEICFENISWLTHTHSESPSLPASTLDAGKVKYFFCESVLHLELALWHNSEQHSERKSAGTTSLSLPFFLHKRWTEWLMFIALRQEAWDKAKSITNIDPDIIEPLNKVSNLFLYKVKIKFLIVSATLMKYSVTYSQSILLYIPTPASSQHAFPV